MEIIKTDIAYKVENDKSYFLSIDIGAGQKGSSSFRNLQGDYIHGEIDHVLIGTGSALKGNYLKVASMITDIRHDTNDIYISYSLNGHPIKELDEEAEEDHGSVFFKTKIKFE